MIEVKFLSSNYWPLNVNLMVNKCSSVRWHLMPLVMFKAAMWYCYFRSNASSPVLAKTIKFTNLYPAKHAHLFYSMYWLGGKQFKKNIMNHLPVNVSLSIFKLFPSYMSIFSRTNKSFVTVTVTFKEHTCMYIVRYLRKWYLNKENSVKNSIFNHGQTLNFYNSSRNTWI